MKLRTILNIEFVGARPGGLAFAEKARPALGLFRMGEATRGEGDWERWGWALLITVLIHAGAVLVGLSMPKALPKVAPAPTEPELVLLTFKPARAAAAQAPSVPLAQPQKVPPRAHARAVHPLIMPHAPVPLVERAPPPPEPPAPEEAPEAADTTMETGAVGGVVAGLVGSAMTTSEGSGLGTMSGDAVDLKQVSRPPTVLEQVVPQYPRLARSRGIEGLVLVRVIIGTDGRVEPEHTRIIRSVPALDAAAVAAVSQWRFTPALGHQGRPVRVIIEVPVQFSLK